MVIIDNSQRKNKLRKSAIPDEKIKEILEWKKTNNASSAKAGEHFNINLRTLEARIWAYQKRQRGENPWKKKHKKHKFIDLPVLAESEKRPDPKPSSEKKMHDEPKIAVVFCTPGQLKNILNGEI